VDVVPWVDARATQAELARQVAVEPVRPTSIHLPACSPGDLALTSAGRDGAGGHLLYFFEARNVGHTTCRLRAYPTILETAHGRTRALQLKQDTFVPKSGLVTIALRPGDHALAWLDVSAREDLCPGVHHQTGTVSAVAGRHHAVLIDRPVAYCMMTQSAWRPEAGPKDNPNLDPRPAIERQLRGVTARLEALPTTLAPGSPVTYVVALTNTSTHAIALTPCPIYQVDGIGGREVQRLNCAAQPMLPAGATVRFVMRLVPGGAWSSDLGALKLVWRIPGSEVDAHV
jgi:hypothetical protein